MRNHFRIFVFASFSFLVLVAPAQPAFSAKPVDDLPRYLNVSPGVFRGGQPSDLGLQKLRDNGVKTIVDLRNNAALTQHEAERAKDLGLTFVSIPLNGINKPTDKIIDKFLGIVQDPKAQPVFVHCQQGVDRTGTMIAIYREASDKWSAAQAYKEAVKDGFHPQYVWLSEAVFDYEKKCGLPRASSRPLGVKLKSSFERVIGFLKPKRVANTPGVVASDDKSMIRSKV